MQIEHCTAQCGSVVHGLQLAQASPDDVKDLRELLFQRGVLFFRDQVLSEEAHLAFAKRFGDIVVNKFFGIVPGYPEIAEVRKEPDQTMNIGGGWHTDHSYDPDPALGSILVARELPETGGDTLFTNAQASCAALPAELKTLALKDGYKDNQKNGFKRTYFPWLYEVPEEFRGKIKTPHVTLDLYPRVEALSTGKQAASYDEVRETHKLDQSLYAFFDFDRIYLKLQNYKIQRSWSNLRLDKEKLLEFCSGAQDWYTLYIPGSELKLTDFSVIKKLEGILVRLLIDYTDRFYKALKAGYEGQFYEVSYVQEDDGSMLKLYQFQVEDTDDGREYLNKLETLKSLVAEKKIGEASKWNAPHMVAVTFDRHLYYPLLSLEDKEAVPLKMRPLAFDSPSEVQFVEDLQAFYSSEKGKEVIGARSLYLLRNA
ncbi:MAG: TauD/TfdA family dioxygenase, partial [Halieaceae bacterium]